MNIGQAVKEVRRIKYPNLAQYAFAKCIGITPAYLSQLENGKRDGSLVILKRVADFCEIPLPIIFWFSIEEHDILDTKKVAYKVLKPSIDALIKELVITK